MTRFKGTKKYTALNVDTFDHEESSLHEFDTLEEAKAWATEHSGTMLKSHVYEDGLHVFQAGTF